VRKSLKSAGIEDISISANQGKLLYFLAILSRASRILEIGTLAGYSTIWLARALPASGRLISIESNPDHAAIARKSIARAGLSSLVDIVDGNALQVLPELHQHMPHSFDVVFIDADKASLAEYFRWALNLAHGGSLIIADNVVRQGTILQRDSPDKSVQGVQRFLEKLAAEKNVTSVVLQTVGAKEHDGMALSVVNEAPRR